MNSTPVPLHGEPSVKIQSDLTTAWLTLRGGHIAPVDFRLDDGMLAQPYSLAPWEPSDYPEQPPILQILRGDFFCLPFGADPGQTCPHGDPANARWQITKQDESSLALAQKDISNQGCIKKRVHLSKGQRVLYQEHLLDGFDGPFCYGHHPILHIPKGVSCPLRTSAFKFAQTCPSRFANPELGEHGCLAQGARFDSLSAVPLANGGTLDLRQYPHQSDCEDLLMLTPAETGLAWTALTFPGYVWLSLRSTVQFPSTVLWLSNGGRPQPPWDGRHTRRIGVEDVCAYFAEGPAASTRQPLSNEGIKTAHHFTSGKTVLLRHAQGVHPVKGQPGLAELQPVEGEQTAKLIFEDGQAAYMPMDWHWLLEPDQGLSQ